MKTRLSGLLLLCVGMAVTLPQAWATDAAPVHKKVAKKAHHKPAPASADEASAQPVSMSGPGTEFQCELGNRLTVYEHPEDTNRIGLRWDKRVHELTRVQTTTGANRFENKESGLVWISIPSKSMLLDSKKGQQLANECRTRDQLKMIKAKT